MEQAGTQSCSIRLPSVTRCCRTCLGSNRTVSGWETSQIGPAPGPSLHPLRPAGSATPVLLVEPASDVHGRRPLTAPGGSSRVPLTWSSALLTLCLILRLRWTRPRMSSEVRMAVLVGFLACVNGLPIRQHERCERSTGQSAWNAATNVVPITSTRRRTALASRRPDGPPKPATAWNLLNPSARAVHGRAVLAARLE